MKVDLHMHTTFSDGFFSPQELIKKCSEKELSVISITDHDSVESFPDSIKYGKEYDVEVICGVELSTTIEEKDIHILGYFVDYTNSIFLETLQFFRAERKKRAERIIEKLNDLKIFITLADIEKYSGQGAIGRPHIANALVEHGYVRSYKEAFDKYLIPGSPAYETKFPFHSAEAIQLIKKSGGLSFIAHPGEYITENILRQLIKEGIDGIEVIHPSHSSEHINYYRGIVNEYFLLESGGSDFHGGRKNDDSILGSYYIDETKIEMMKRNLFS